MRIFEFKINPDDDTLGMSCISLVDKPAMESEFLAFNKPVKQKFIALGEEKRMVAGLALIPDKLVFRVDDETGEEYLGYFSAETIEEIRNKFMRDKNIDAVNLQHDSNSKVNAYLVESYILNTEQRVNEVKSMGIEDACLGCWFVAYKFGSTPEAQQAFEDALNGKYTGFSIEVMLQRELKLNKKSNNKHFVMAKINKLIDKFKTILAEFEEVQTLEDANLADGSGVLRYAEVNTPVLKVIVAEDGTETTEVVAEGEYILEIGKTIVVDAQGNLVEVKEGVAPEAALPEGMAEEVKPDEALAVSGDTEVIVPAEGEVIPPVEEGAPAIADVSAKTLGEIVDVSKDGDYYITVSVAGGKIVEAYIEVEQSLVKAQDFQAQTTTIETLNAEILALKAQLAKPIGKSIMEFTTPKPETKTKAELAKMSNLEVVLNRLNLK